LILLLVGELLTGLWQQEFNMRINEGETRNYAESYQHVELAIVDVTDPKTDVVVAIPESFLAHRETVQHPVLPFRVVPRAYFPNSNLVMAGTVPANDNDRPVATTGIGQRMAAIGAPVTYKQDERNTPAAYVELVGPQGTIGTWMVSSEIPTPQHFEYGGHAWKIALRFQRRYEPFSLTLLKFSHDVYPGTEIPKNFSSRVRLRTDDGGEDREVLIYMNNPLRYAGLTFYQSSYEGEHTTILQVVHNPSWLLPYIACSLVAFGLVVQFGIHLFAFIGRRAAGSNATESAAANGRRGFVLEAPPLYPAIGLGDGAPSWWQRWTPLLATAFAVLLFAGGLRPPKSVTAFDYVAFGRLPVLANGRFKPLDTVARSSLLQFRGKQSVKPPGYRAPGMAEYLALMRGQPLPADRRLLKPDEWLLQVVFNSDIADTYQIFKIVHPDVLTIFGLTREDGLDGDYFSVKQLSAKLGDLERQANLANAVESGARSPFQRAVLQLYESLVQYQRLRHMFVAPGSKNFLGELFEFQQKVAAGVEAVRAKQADKPHDEALVNRMLELGQEFDTMATTSNFLVIPPLRGESDPNKWRTTGAALLETFQTGEINPAALAYAGLGRAWRDEQPEKFNELLSIFRRDFEKRYGAPLHKSDIEVRFNAVEPFYRATIVYVLAFVAAIGSWLVWPRALGRAAFALVAIAWVATTAGIATRMWLEGRPPVTNLYSSALFVGWGSVALCLVLEYTYRNAIGSAAGALIGFATLIIAHMLSLSGDTLEMMRAVLDSNFWLATHVVVVALGYASTFLAGFLALIYVVRGVLTRSLDQETADALSRMVYGIVCFATLFSFTGTILGGIWADQSWGRFWGWDPKENGALIIVVWNAIILHARWGRMVGQRGLMNLAIFGNIVTSWSWFGTNMLGVGLHSYGFTEAAFWSLIAFVATQLAFIVVGSLPFELWRSARPQQPTESPAVPVA
jgi:ABC-type transport system involved in cytochrome c biogenesis permease subunit